RTSEAPIELVFRPDPTIGDGEAGWANHPWLQETPKPFSHITWENVALIAPITAAALGLDDAPSDSRDTLPILRITVDSQTIEIPAWIQPGIPEKTITLHLGSGHTSGGEIQRRSGVNIYPLRTLSQPWHRADHVHIENTRHRAEVAFTQATPFMSRRDAARS